VDEFAADPQALMALFRVAISSTGLPVTLYRPVGPSANFPVHRAQAGRAASG